MPWRLAMRKYMCRKVRIVSHRVRATIWARSLNKMGANSLILKSFLLGRNFFHRRTKSTRKRNTPENADPEKSLKKTPENAAHPKSQILGTIDYLRFRVCCAFGCVLAPAKNFWDVPGGGVRFVLSRLRGIARSPKFKHPPPSRVL